MILRHYNIWYISATAPSEQATHFQIISYIAYLR